MRLLILTQKVDKNDDLLGFFHGWLIEFAKNYDHVTVLCLGKGEYSLPDNVEVLSLGKETGVSNVAYVRNFYRYIWQKRYAYDAVFVHMNAEYVALGGIFWRLWRKKLALWYNHPKGSVWLRISHILPHVIFCTSPFAYSKRYKKTHIMPAGVDTNVFTDMRSERKKNSILLLGRISPVKRVHVFAEALTLLSERHVSFSATIVGNAPPQDTVYEQSVAATLKPLSEKGMVVRSGSVPNYQAPEVYNTHVFYVNLTPTGSMDKTILEAMACGCIPIVSNRFYEGVLPGELIFKEDDAHDLSVKIKSLFSESLSRLEARRKEYRAYVERDQSLAALMKACREYL